MDTLILSLVVVFCIKPKSSKVLPAPKLGGAHLEPCGSAGLLVKNRDLGSIPGFGRSPGEGKGYPVQYSGLENSMDCRVHGITESDMTERLSP